MDPKFHVRGRNGFSNLKSRDPVLETIPVPVVPVKCRKTLGRCVCCDDAWFNQRRRRDVLTNDTVSVDTENRNKPVCETQQRITFLHPCQWLAEGREILLANELQTPRFSSH